MPIIFPVFSTIRNFLIVEIKSVKMKINILQKTFEKALKSLYVELRLKYKNTHGLITDFPLGNVETPSKINVFSTFYAAKTLIATIDTPIELYESHRQLVDAIKANNDILCI